MSKMSQLAAYELETADLDQVAGGKCNPIAPVKIKVGVVNVGNIAGNVVGVGGDVIADNGGSVTIVGGNVASA